MISRFALLLLAVALAFTASPAQTPAPVIVQAMPASTPLAAAVPPASAGAADQSAIKILQEMKAANDLLLSKQTAVLEQLDELEKAAEQLKVYSKRG